jgi:hypothetical protein
MDGDKIWVVKVLKPGNCSHCLCACSIHDRKYKERVVTKSAGNMTENYFRITELTGIRCQIEVPKHLAKCLFLVSVEPGVDAMFLLSTKSVNPLKPNDAYRRRTAPLTSKVAFYIFIQQI